MNSLRIPRWLAVMFLAILLMVCAVVFCFFQLRVTDNSLSPQLQIGDRVFIDRLSTLRRGKIVAYQNPFMPTGVNYCLGRCLAVPGDTLRLYMEEHVSDSVPLRHVWRDFIVPRRNQPVEVTQWNRELLSNALFAYEGANVCPQCDTILLVNGQPLRHIIFSHDFVWISARGDSIIADSRLFGFLPTDHILGSVSFITYSIGKDFSIPLNRIFRSIDN